MLEVTVEGPFQSTTPGYIHLPEAPLLSTLAQVRFPVFSTFMADEGAAAKAVAASLADRYPLFEEGQQTQFMITPDGVAQTSAAGKLWKLSTADRRWNVTFASAFLSLDTSGYTRRSDFADRLDDAWQAFRAVARPPYIERLGVRYVNRIENPKHLGKLSMMIRPQVLGLLGAPVGQGVIVSDFTETQYKLAAGPTLQVRRGLVPAGVVLDASMTPVSGPSWLLDLDSYREWSPAALEPGDDLGGLTSGLAMHAYQFFRWAVTDEYLTTFGGELP